MRFEGYRKSKADDKRNVYVFSIGEEEIRVMDNLLANYISQSRKTPVSLRDNQNYQRIRNVRQCLSKILINLENPDNVFELYEPKPKKERFSKDE